MNIGSYFVQLACHVAYNSTIYSFNFNNCAKAASALIKKTILGINSLNSSNVPSINKQPKTS